ncbi:MAG: Rrf2 family transcriptional regulator [Actinomycetia bacterium]|nr:Rrf2 family transcriptional regulator [Actinomycetes bacterium]
MAYHGRCEGVDPRRLRQPYLEQILRALKGAGLVRSKRGVGGGYVLARDTTQINLADLATATGGDTAWPS